MEVTITDQRHKVSTTSGYLNDEVITRDSFGIDRQVKGIVATPYGKVECYTYHYKTKGNKVFKRTQLSIILNGFEYTRTIIGKYYSPIGMARIAGSFAKEKWNDSLKS